MFQCSVRDLILITCIAALLVAWSLDHRWQAEADAKLQKFLTDFSEEQIDWNQITR